MEPNHKIQVLDAFTGYINWYMIIGVYRHVVTTDNAINNYDYWPPYVNWVQFHSEAVQTLFFNQLQDVIKIIWSGWDYVMFMHLHDTYLYYVMY